MNESVRSLLWNSADRLYFGSPLMKVIFVCELASSIVATVFAAVMATTILLTRLLHFNIRLLLACTCTAMVISNVGMKHINANVELVKSLPILAYLKEVQHTFCRFPGNGLKKLYNAGGMTVVMSTVFMAIERLVATCLYKTYQRRSHKWMGIALSVLLWMTFIHSWFFVPDQGDTVYHFCDPGMYDIHFAKVADIVLLVLQVVAVLTFVGLWHRNKRLTCTLDDRHLRVQDTRYQLKENINTTRLMIPIVTINAVLVLSYSVTYAIFFPSLGQNASITKELLNSINQYAPVAEFLILLMPVVTSAFIFCIPLLSAHIRRSLFRLTGLRHCFQDSSNRIDSVEQAATRIYFEMLEKQWEESFKRERRRLPARSQNYFAGAT
ncbi:unnamed protein product [Toxocara canis]|uniref:G_PROTEIN_RECEP_F1_2 domain-containing protein n=1 Tax=Toxocara canis TaxID=6265 RepID=A0A183TXG3_TOXCA|nr:unnamed protein product [Toxocara canis]